MQWTEASEGETVTLDDDYEIQFVKVGYGQARDKVKFVVRRKIKVGIVPVEAPKKEAKPK